MNSIAKPIVIETGTGNRKRTIKDWISTSAKQNVRQYTMFIALLLIWVMFAILTDGIFITSRNLSNLFLQMVTIGFLACGMVLVIVATHIDLSVGSVAATLGAIAAYLMDKLDVNPWLAIIITLVAGLLVGCWHGYWISYRGVPAFIVTLASMTAFKGVTLAITKGATIGEFPSSFKAIGQGYVPKLFFHDAKFNDTSVIIGLLLIIGYIVMEAKKRASRKKYGFDVPPIQIQIIKLILVSALIALACSIMISYMGIPYAVLLLLGVVILFTFITNKTTFGRNVYASGGNKEAARLSGINIKRVGFSIFALMGILNAIAAIVFTARLNAATPSAGNLFELDAVAACYIGGTSPLGGVGTIYGAIIGALIMASLDNGMSLMNLPIMFQYIIKGMILLSAVWIDFATKKKAL